MKIKKVFNLIFHNSGYYIWLMFLCAFIVAMYDIKAALAVAVTAGFCLAMVLITGSMRRSAVKHFISTLTYGMSDGAKDALGYGLIPIIIIRRDGIIVWANESFETLTSGAVSTEVHVNEAIPEFNIKQCIDAVASGNEYKITHGGKTYKIWITTSEHDSQMGDAQYYAIYFNDCTELDTLKKRYDDERFVSGVITVDNYDEIMQDVPNPDKPKVSAAIEETLNVYAQDANGIMKKLEKDKYLFYFSKWGLDKFIEKKFDILDKIKEISAGNKLPPTISMGLGYGGESMSQDDLFSYTALDMALGRGGDQVIVKNPEKYTFFGGKSKESEKRARVKARVAAYAMRQLVNENNDILIMGHKNADPDAFGAAIGLYRTIKYLGKNCKIVMETYNRTVSRLLEKFTDDEYEDLIINKAYANEIVTKSTLIFVVDTHVKSLLEEPSLLDVTKKVVVIDHHRRSTDFIQNPLITYHEPYASSTAELVTEIIQYIGDDIKPKKCEAEALYAGMYLDTKNFTFKTGVRTFEAASYLRRLGVDTVSVKKIFQIDMNTFMKKWAIMENAVTYKHCVSIATCVKNDADMQTIVAQVADELLNITDITCSFVLCDMGASIIISARSLGDYNVQVIMEKLGGGGHMTIAAAQLSGVSIDNAEKQLKSAIDEYIEENRRN